MTSFACRLVKAYDDLSEYLKNESELHETKEYGAAAEMLKLAKETIDTN